MKKKYFWLLSMLSVGATVLTSCAVKINIDNIDNNDYSDYIDENIEEETVTSVDPDFVKTNEIISDRFDKDLIVNDSYYSSGLLVIKNEFGNIGFYSLAHKKYIVQPMFSEYYLDYNVQVDNYVGFILTITNLHERYVYDSFGNLLYQVTEKASDEGYTYTTTIGNGKYTSSIIDQVTYETINNVGPDEDSSSVSEIYLIMKFSGEKEREFIYRYDEYYSNTIVDEIPDKTISTENDYVVGNKYTDMQKIDLTDYGLENYYLSKKDKYYTVFKTDGGNDSNVVTFVIPSDVKDSSLILLDHYCIYQRKVELPEDATEYIFYDGDTKIKYNLTSYRVDLLTGTTEEIEVNYCINSIDEYKDNNGIIKYSLIEYQEIVNNILQPTKKNGIINYEYKVLRDVTSTAPIKYIKLDETHYYNEGTKIVYDNNMNEIVYLGAINPVLDPDSKLFTGCIEGLYGAVDYDGNVVADFRYKQFICDFVDGYGIGSKVKNNKTEYYRINTNEKNSEYLGDNIKKVSDNVYYVLTGKIEDTNTYKGMIILSEKENINSYTFETKYIKNVGYKGITAQNVSYKDIKLLNKNSNIYLKVTSPVDINYYINAKEKSVNNLTSYGTEVSIVQNVGQTKENMPTIHLGNNELVLTNKTSFSNYFSFTGENDKYYTLNFDKNVFVRIYNENDEVVSTESKSNVVYFKSDGTKYTIILSSSQDASLDMNSQTNYLKCKVVYEYGQNAEYPIEANMLSNINVEKNKTYYIKFNPQVSGEYFFSMDKYTISTDDINLEKYSQATLYNNDNGVSSAYLVSDETYEFHLISNTFEYSSHDLFIELGETIDSNDSPLYHTSSNYYFYNVNITNDEIYYLYNNNYNDKFIIYKYDETNKEFVLFTSGSLSSNYKELALTSGKYYIGVSGSNYTAYFIKGSGNYSFDTSKSINNTLTYSGIYFINSYNLFYKFNCISTREYSIINDNANNIVVYVYSDSFSIMNTYNIEAGKKLNVSLTSGNTYYFEVKPSVTNRGSTFKLEYLYNVDASVNYDVYGSFDFTVNNIKPDTTYCSKGDKVALTAKENEGYTFLGWYDGDKLLTTDKKYEFTMSKDINYQAKFANYTLTYSSSNAVYGTVSGVINKTSATVSFDSQGGSTVASQTVTETNGLEYPTNPTKSGYVFRGWYKYLTDTTPYDFSKEISDDLTLYAKWVQMNTGYSSTAINILNYTSSSSYYSQYTSGSSSNPTYTYFTVPTSGTYSFYYANSSSSSSYYNYLYVYNVTQGKAIKSNGYITSTSWSSTSFTANAGDVIMVRTYPYSYNTYLYYYVSGITNVTDGGLLDTIIDSGNSITAGESIKLIAKENEGYSFVGWYDGDKLISTEKEYEFTMPSQSVNYQAKFEVE